MKRIIYTCLAAIAAAYTAPAADEAPATPAAKEEPAAADAAQPSPDAEANGEATENADVAKVELKSDNQAIAALLDKNKKLDELYASIKKPDRRTRDHYSNHTNEVRERVAKLEGIVEKLKELESKRASFVGMGFEYTIVPREERDKYDREGGELAKKVLDALTSKSESAQVDGLRGYDALKESYQGHPRFKEVTAVYQKLVMKLDKRWTTQRENMRKERQKWAQAKQDKVLESENAQYQTLARRLEADDINIDETWFMPKMSNSVMLDKALDRTKRVKQSMQSRSIEVTENVPKVIEEFWAAEDVICELMIKGEYEEALNKQGEDETYRAVNSLGRFALPEMHKDGIRKQHEELVRELRKRKNDCAVVERQILTTTNTFERELSNLESRIERVYENLEAAKEREVEMEEQKAREAEEEAARAAEEAEREAEEAEEKPEKPAKKKSSKKKQKTE